MRVMDLPGWVRQPSGRTSESQIFPISADKVIIENVLGVMQDHVLFSCQFEGRSVFYDFPLLDEKNREKIVEILHENTGKSLLSIGSIEIPKKRGFVPPITLLIPFCSG